jgi:hypothetical protein
VGWRYIVGDVEGIGVGRQCAQGRLECWSDVVNDVLVISVLMPVVIV